MQRSKGQKAQTSSKQAPDSQQRTVEVGVGHPEQLPRAPERVVAAVAAVELLDDLQEAAERLVRQPRPAGGGGGQGGRRQAQWGLCVLGLGPGRGLRPPLGLPGLLRLSGATCAPAQQSGTPRLQAPDARSAVRRSRQAASRRPHRSAAVPCSCRWPAAAAGAEQQAAGAGPHLACLKNSFPSSRGDADAVGDSPAGAGRGGESYRRASGVGASAAAAAAMPGAGGVCGRGLALV
jgi:hypothetical protein